MKKAILKAVIVAAVFVITAFVTSMIINKDSTDLTTQMSDATFPVVHTEYEGQYINTMYGYVSDMDLSFMRDTITPLMPGRKLSLKIDLYENYIGSLMYEVRTLDGTRLIEQTEVSDYEYGDGSVSAEITVKDLIENDRESEFVVILNTADDKKIRYYTRIISPEESYVSEKLSYVTDFSNRTFNKQLAEDLIKYLESNSQGDNSSYGHVDIHSSFDQVTWGDLNPLRVSEPTVTIRELSPLTGSFLVDYFVSVTMDTGDIRYYRVEEFFRIRYSKERMYLLDYERRMDEIFTDDKSAYSEEMITLGITGETVGLKESEDGTNFAFVSGERLYAVNTTENRSALLFGFYEDFDGDIRRMNRDHGIKIMSVDEAGNVSFIVYGYMNRGLHEGESGIAAYYYDASVNTVEELAYIPSSHAPDLLSREVEELSYMNGNGILYLLSGGTLYAIDAKSRIVENVATGLTDGNFRISESGKLIAYPSDNGLKFYHFETERSVDLKAPYGQKLIPVSFIGEDLIYGELRNSDVFTSEYGETIEPMHRLVISNFLEGEVMTYSREDEGIYILSGIVEENQITLKRMQKDEDGVFTDTTDDQIMNSADIVELKNTVTSVPTEDYELVTAISVKNGLAPDTLTKLRPKQVLFEGSRTIELSGEETIRYVVYGRYGADSVLQDEGNAVARAYEISGSVMNVRGDYLYRKTSRSTKNQIMAITEDEVSEDRGSLAVCMDTLLTYEGPVRNSQYMLDNGKTVLEILSEALEGCEVLDLTGVNLDTVLYYVNMDIPVLVLLEDEEREESNAVLLIGYNESNTVVMDPEKGEIYKVGMEDSESWFCENGNRFITYVRLAD